MTETTSIQLLENFANKKGIKHYSSSNRKDHLLITGDRFLATKYVVFDFNEVKKDLYFIFYDSFSPKAYTSKSYCGFFQKITNCKHEIKIIKRDWFDMFSFKKRYKTGFDSIDKKVSIFTSSKETNPTFVNSKTITEFLQVAKTVMPLELITIHNSQSVIPELVGNDFVAIQTNKWILNLKELDAFLTKGAEFMKKL